MGMAGQPGARLGLPRAEPVAEDVGAQDRRVRRPPEVLLDAVDVAMTEASVGAGMSTVLLLAALHLTRGQEVKPLHRPLLPLVVAIAIGAALVYGTFGLPAFSDPQAVIHTHVVPRYLLDSLRETGVPNVVTSVLASYRGYDTLGETTVVFTAGAGVIALLRRRRGRKDQ